MFKKFLLSLTCVVGSLGWAIPNQAFSIQNIGSHSNLNSPTYLTFDSNVNPYASNPSNTIAESAKSGLKNQLKGKWKLIGSDNSSIEYDNSLLCIDEFVDNHLIASCDRNGKHLYTITYNYQILSDNLIYVTSQNFSDQYEVKIDGDEMQLEGQLFNSSARFKRIK